MLRTLLNSMLYFPARSILETPASAGLEFADIEFDTADGEKLHAWWTPSGAERPPEAHVLLCHGNAGNVGDRVLHAASLTAAGLDVLLFDYRGYGRSSGAPGEEGTYLDARAAREALLRQPGVDPSRIVYLGESLGAAVALELALEAPPAGLVLQSAFTSVRDMARFHYRVLPPGAVPDAYPNLARIGRLDAPLLVLHGDRDDIVPLSHGEALHAAAPDPKRLHVFRGSGHNDLVLLAGAAYGETIATWAGEVGARP